MATNVKYRMGEGGIVLRLTVGATIVSGDPIEIVDLHGLALTSYNADDGKADVLLPGITAVADVNAEAVNNAGNSAIALGDKLYYDTAATIKVNKDGTNGKGYGYALETIGAGSSDTIQVALTQS